MELDALHRQLAVSQRFFRKAADKAASAYAKGDFESAVAWAKVAAHFAFIRHPGFYVDKPLERMLMSIAQQVNDDIASDVNMSFKPKDYGRMRFLHVVTESYSTGGIANFITAWIQNTAGSSVHSLITTTRQGEITEELATAIENSGGWFGTLSELSPNLVERAVFLRKIARNWADVIVLFVHPFDPVPMVAFGVDGGPPVIFVNHADQAFWLGSAIADVLVDFHSLGGLLAAERRGIYPSRILPIPLRKANRNARNLELREKLGISDTDVMLLTVGRDEKFLPFAGCDFLDIMVKVLKNHPKAKLFAAGPKNQGRWKQASNLASGQIRLVGTLEHTMLEDFYDAADVYVESFPCGSMTALLEAGVHEVPMVGLHLKQIPHVSGEDDMGLQRMRIHASSIDGFIRTLNRMIKDCDSYRTKAHLIKENIEQEHCSPGWNTYLDRTLQLLPSQHHVREPQQIDSQTAYYDLYFSYLGSEMAANELLEHSFARLVRVYRQHLPKADAFKTQAVCMLQAFFKVDSVRRAKDYLYSLREFINTTFN